MLAADLMSRRVGRMGQETNDVTETAPLVQRGHGFIWMMICSLIIHAGIVLCVGTGKGGTRSVPAVTYLDLRMLQPSTTTAEPSPPVPQPQVTPTVPPARQPAAATAYDRLEKEVQNALQSGETRPGAVNSVSFGLGMTSGYFSSLSEGKSLRPDIREYYFNLLQRVNETWWVNKDSQSGGWGRDAIVNVVIARNGTVVNLELYKSSGNSTRDRALLKSLETASPLPALPDSYTDEYFAAPLRFVEPLNLMAPAVSGDGVSGHSESSTSNSSRSRS